MAILAQDKIKYNEQKQVVQNVQNKGLVTAHQAMSYFSNQASKPGCAWAAHFRPAFHPSQPDGPCYLQCKHCDEYLSASNTSSILKSHKSACKPKPKPAIAPVAVAALVDAGQGKTQPVKGPMDQFVSSVSPALEQQVLDELAMFIYTSETPFQRINNKHLIKAFQLLGVKLPGETALRTTMLDRAYQRVQATAQAQLDSAAAGSGHMQLVTDGWRSKYAEDSEPLINVVLTLPDGGSSFVKLVKTGGQIKDANYLVNLHDGLATEVTEGKPEELGGVLMDNTATNRLAMAQLELLHPQQLCMGCSAHALNLLFKDLAKQPAAIGEKRARGRPSASSNTTNTTTKKDKPVSPAVAAIYEKARMISMVVGDSAPIRSLLHQKQMAAYGRIKVIHANCPTR